MLVVVNLSGTSLPSVELRPAANVGGIDGVYTELFSGREESLRAGQTLALSPWEYRVYVRGPTR